MKPTHHLLVVFICVGILWFDIKTYPDILDTPYMTGLLIVLILVGYWNLILSIS